MLTISLNSRHISQADLRFRPFQSQMPLGPHPEKLPLSMPDRHEQMIAVIIRLSQLLHRSQGLIRHSHVRSRMTREPCLPAPGRPDGTMPCLGVPTSLAGTSAYRLSRAVQEHLRLHLPFLFLHRNDDGHQPSMPTFDDRTSAPCPSAAPPAAVGPTSAPGGGSGAYGGGGFPPDGGPPGERTWRRWSAQWFMRWSARWRWIWWWRPARWRSRSSDDSAQWAALRA